MLITLDDSQVTEAIKNYIHGVLNINSDDFEIVEINDGHSGEILGVSEIILKRIKDENS